MDSETWGMIGFSAFAIALVLIVACGFDSYGCHSKWQRSGFQVSWGPVQGCLISKDGKVFIPEDNYRELKD